MVDGIRGKIEMLLRIYWCALCTKISFNTVRKTNKLELLFEFEL